MSLAAVQNHNSLHLPAAFDLVLGEAVVTVFVVETTCGDAKVEENPLLYVLYIGYIYRSLL